MSWGQGSVSIQIRGRNIPFAMVTVGIWNLTPVGFSYFFIDFLEFFVLANQIFGGSGYPEVRWSEFHCIIKFVCYIRWNVRHRWTRTEEFTIGQTKLGNPVTAAALCVCTCLASPPPNRTLHLPNLFGKSPHIQDWSKSWLEIKLVTSGTIKVRVYDMLITVSYIIKYILHLPS